MKKFAFIGAGSVTFTRTVVRDLFTFPAFADAEIALMDINSEKLDYIRRCCEKIKDAMGVDAKITATTDRVEALRGADGIVCTVFNGDIDVWKYDIEIPKKYGVDMNIGDTRSIAGIFRAARNIPLMLDICRDIEKYCPNAVFLNYTNPMSMLCRAMQLYSNVNVTGLCHSVQGTIDMLASWLGAPIEEITYTCAGVNHQAFYTEIKWNGVDAYPLLREKLNDPVYYNKEIVRNEMFKHFGYYVTESSGHNSEYNYWFRKRPDLIEKYCSPHEGANWNPGEYAFSLNLRKERLLTWRDDFEKWIQNGKVDKNRSREYCAEIFNAMIGDGKPFEFNGNVINDGCIKNLPDDTCVEVPVVASRFGLRKCVVGSLPDEVAILVNTTARMENLAVEAIMQKDKRKLIQACYMDPLCSAVCSLSEIESMANELFEINKEFLGDYK
ncbi:MAG: alpha-galactosidase [Clostridia bacterium]|nr:alpha-galactosidase [Clostridia bacterium]